MRLNKYLSDAGVCSRREADRLVQDGKVTVDGKTAVLGMQIEEGQEIWVNGKEVRREEKKVLLLFHKPRGIECTANPKVKNNVISYIDYPIRIYYIGRLDKVPLQNSRTIWLRRANGLSVVTVLLTISVTVVWIT